MKYSSFYYYNNRNKLKIYSKYYYNYNKELRGESSKIINDEDYKKFKQNFNKKNIDKFSNKYSKLNIKKGIITIDFH